MEPTLGADTARGQKPVHALVRRNTPEGNVSRETASGKRVGVPRETSFHGRGGSDRLEWVQEISTLVSNVGFPIACVCILFWFQWQERKTHREETESFAAAIENNTVVMQEVKTLIETLGR